ncbi:hypothetical protein [Herbidospora daliensis]|uniref:hypothetical protein n=1 Tax=Herbidospora daliensis TaxID=295585 RepID=UPI00078598D8|nr:hypothetical protein [Herbidospora daliensis]
MLHTVLRRRAGGETVEQIRPDLIIPTGRRKGHALADHDKTQAHADFAALQTGRWPQADLFNSAGSAALSTAACNTDRLGVIAQALMSAHWLQSVITQLRIARFL